VVKLILDSQADIGSQIAKTMENNGKLVERTDKECPQR
jgi:hypothetical protein